MGVAGLWEVLRPAGETRSLTELAVMDGFIDNSSGQRGFRIGIDASIWFFHAAYGKEGENPELRTLFFRCCRLLQTPLLPLFVFDGPKRPAIKRGKRVGGNAHWLTTGMKNMIQAFGFEYRTAPGEAEAELAYLNRIGVIDAVLSDDVDNFLFGATMVIRNPSNTLSGNRSHPVKNAAGRDDGNHVLTYRSSDLSTNPSVQLTRSGTILIALLSGGDYIPAGLPGCGRAFATGLARAGFGDTLVDAVATMKGRELEKFLRRWREDIRTELRTNKSGLLPTKKPSLASSLPDTFPSLPVLLSYVSPITSETEHSEPLPVKWPHDPDPKQIAALCELYFEWGVKDVIVKRFRTVLWPGIVCRAVRRAVLEGDMTGDNACLPSKPAPSTSTSSSQPEPGQAFSLAFLVPLTAVQPPRSSSPIHNNGDTEDPHRPLLTNLLSSRTHASTNHTPEYRVCIDPTSLVRRAEAGVRGIRPPLESALLVTAVSSEEEEDGDEVPELDSDTGDGDIQRLETTAAAKKKAMKSKKSGKRSTPVAPDTPLRIWIPACMLRAAASELVETYEVRETVKRTKKKAKASQRGPRAKDVMKETDNQADMSTKTDKVHKPASRTAKVTSTGARRRKPKHTSEAQDDEYEVIDLSAASSCSSDELVDGVTKKTSNVGKKANNKETTTAAMREKSGPTVKAFFRTKKPLATSIGIAKSKASTSTYKSSVPSSKTKPFPLYDDDDDDPNEERSPAPSLAQAVRPLDLVRSKRNPSSTAVAQSRLALYTEEEGSPNSGPASANKLATRKQKVLDMSSDDDIEVSDVRSGACSSTGNIGTSSHPGSTADGSRHTKLPVASRSGSKLAHIRLPSSTEEESSEQEAADTLQASRKSRPKDKAASGKSKFKPAPHTFPMPSPPRNALSSITTDEFTTSHHPASPPLQVPSSSRHPEESTDNALNPSSPKPPSRVDDESRNNSLPKYFRKSTFHTSPRHVRRGPALLNSPTSPSTALDWPDRKAILSSTAQVIREPGAIQWTSSSTSGYIARHKSESVIYISSDSEDDNAGDADTAIILSHPPALFPPHSLFTSTSASTIGKSKTNLSVASTAHTARTGSVAETTLKNAPLLAARAKASTDDTVGRTGLFLGSKPISMNSRAKIPVSSQDIIDLT